MSSKPEHFIVLVFLFLGLLLAIGTACNLPEQLVGKNTVAGTLHTYAAQTMNVRRTATAAERERVTATPEPAKSTANLPLIVAQVNTNCRSGPNIIYDRVGWLLVGKQSSVHGRNEEQTWWYIANPTKAGEYCWVWGQTTTITGELALLPVITPPALAEIEFRAVYSGLKRCFGNQVIVFLVENTGDVAFFQASITIHTLKNQAVVFSKVIDKPYLSDENDCPPGRKSLPVGDSAAIAIEKTSQIPFDKPLRATIILCTKPDPEKTCVQKKVEFEIKK